MYLKARLVYFDCKASFSELTNGLVAGLWRRKWAAFITLLRAIGHVLEKVDADKWIGLEKIVKDEWGKLKEEKIFNEFIDKERNNVLKEYEFNADQNLKVDLNYTPLQSTPWYSIKDGYYAGKDPRIIGKEALDWRDSKLKTIEQRWRTSRENLITHD